MNYSISIPKKKGYWVQATEASDVIIQEMDKWIQDNKLGKRMSYDMWQLKSAAAQNWFMLKWA